MYALEGNRTLKIRLLKLENENRKEKGKKTLRKIKVAQ